MSQLKSEVENKTVYIEKRYLDYVKELVKPWKGEGNRIIVYGSRAKGDHKKFSDLDICLKNKYGQKLNLASIADLKDTFSESNLPIFVDVLDYYRVPESFRKIIDQDGIEI